MVASMLKSFKPVCNNLLFFSGWNLVSYNPLSREKKIEKYTSSLYF